MSSTTIADFVRPWRRSRSAEAQANDRAERRLSRAASVFWALSIAAFACVCVVWNRAAQQTLIDFALGVMTYAYSGLLGVFFTLLFSRRGNARSAIAAMIAGFAVVFLLDSSLWSNLLAPRGAFIAAVAEVRHDALDAVGLADLAFAWRLTIAACIATIICHIGRRPLT